MRVLFSFGKVLSLQQDVCTELLAIVEFDKRRKFWHDHSRRNAEQFPVISQGLCVISGRRRDHAAFLLIGRKLSKRIARPAFLKTSGALQVFELAKNFHAGDLAQRNGWRAGRIKHRAFDALAGRFDVFERDHAL